MKVTRQIARLEGELKVCRDQSCAKVPEVEAVPAKRGRPPTNVMLRGQAMLAFPAPSADSAMAVEDSGAEASESGMAPKQMGKVATASPCVGFRPLGS